MTEIHSAHLASSRTTLRRSHPSFTQAGVGAAGQSGAPGPLQMDQHILVARSTVVAARLVAEQPRL